MQYIIKNTIRITFLDSHISVFPRSAVEKKTFSVKTFPLKAVPNRLLPCQSLNSQVHQF